MTRVLHIGNVANNGYINTKLQRRAGLEADALVDEWHILSRPEWEDAPLEGSFGPYDDLGPAAARVGWYMPEWVKTFSRWDPEFKTRPWLRERAALALSVPSVARVARRLSAQYGEVADAQGTGPLTLADVLRAWVWIRRLTQEFGPLDGLFGQYDLVQAYAIHPILPLVVSPERPYVAFEHGTMREVPFEPDWRGRLLSVAYRRAAKVIITNADVLAQAKRLGLENYVFIPHPIDEKKYTPGPSELRILLEAEGFDFVLLCPSRHDWDIKGTDRLLRAYAEFVRNDRPKALLLLNEWGLDLARSRALIEELGIARNVRWLDPQPKLRLIDAYRAADVVLDQFLIGTFGAVAPEAMACGRPVVMAFDAKLHSWCFPELPPIIDARTPEQIYAALRSLSPEKGQRERIGRAGREWVERHHSSQLVVSRHLAVYEEVLQKNPLHSAASLLDRDGSAG